MSHQTYVCSKHGKQRTVSNLNEVTLPNGSIAYECTPGFECKVSVNNNSSSNSSSSNNNSNSNNGGSQGHNGRANNNRNFQQSYSLIGHANAAQLGMFMPDPSRHQFIAFSPMGGLGHPQSQQPPKRGSYNNNSSNNSNSSNNNFNQGNNHSNAGYSTSFKVCLRHGKQRGESSLVWSPQFNGFVCRDDMVCKVKRSEMPSEYQGDNQLQHDEAICAIHNKKRRKAYLVDQMDGTFVCQTNNTCK